MALNLDSGAVLLASPDDKDFDPYETLSYKNDSDEETTFFHHSLIWGEDLENIAILGQGTIDGNRSKRRGPKLLAFKRCRLVNIRDITLTNSPNYNISLLGCEYIGIDGVTILNGFADGIDPDCCRHLRIANCHIESCDDAIVLKSSFALGEHRPTENVTITNCVLCSSCSAFKTGTESGGDFRNIAASNLVMFSPSNVNPKAKRTAAGIELDTVDGGILEGVTVTNVSMAGVRTPIFLRLGNRGRDRHNPASGELRNVTISNIEASAAIRAACIVGLQGHPVESVTISNVRIAFAGGGSSSLATRQVPEEPQKYPSSGMFGELPAYGLYCRHARDIRLRDIELTYRAKEDRSAVICEDVQELQITGLTAESAGSAPVLWLRERTPRRIL